MKWGGITTLKKKNNKIKMCYGRASHVMDNTHSLSTPTKAHWL